MPIIEGKHRFLSYLSFHHVSYEVNGRTVLDDLCLEIDRGETLVLLGRSGSGKTTALRLINRTLQPTSGSIEIDGQDAGQLDPIELRRQIGYVIQDFGLLPHWTVEENILLVPRLLAWPAERRTRRAAELLQQVGLDQPGLGARRPAQLSGGQRQRIAVARALAAEPKLLLFDEPFGALDPVTRHDMQQQFLALQKRYQVTAVFVTHDLLEALALGSRIAVLNGGRLEAVVSASEFWQLQTAEAVAFRNTLPASLRDSFA